MSGSKPSTGGSVTARLTAFLRPSPSAPDAYPERPEGRLIWIHVPQDMPTGPIRELCQIINTQIDDVNCLITADNPDKWQIVEHALIAHLPVDQHAAVGVFLDHWQPDLLLWADRIFRARVLQQFKTSQNPMFLINLPVLDLSRRSLRRSVSSILVQFDAAQVVSAAASERLVSLGFDATKIEQVLPVSEMAWPLKDNDKRRSLAAALGPRPIWCAARLNLSELNTISKIHRRLRKSFPRAVLALIPAEPADGREMIRILSAGGWRVASETGDNQPDRQTDIVVTAGPESLGCWLRLASLALMGGSIAGPEACDPFEAAALGSAIVCGPNTFPFASRYQQLLDGGALVRVAELESLAEQMVNTFAPDRSAELATSAWRVGSEGAAALEKIVDLANSVLQREKS